MTMRSWAGLVVFACLVACGAPREDEHSAGTEASPPLVGTYTMDVERTTGGMTTDAEGRPVALPRDVLRKVQASHGASDFRLELRADHTFVYVVPMGKDTWTTGGTWAEKDGVLSMTTTTVGGKPAEAEMARTETYVREGAFLVLEQDGRRIYLAREPDER